MAEIATDFDGVPWRLIDALPAAIYVTDSAGRITYFNEAARCCALGLPAQTAQ
jgi:hypothetical protein